MMAEESKNNDLKDSGNKSNVNKGSIAILLVSIIITFVSWKAMLIDIFAGTIGLPFMIIFAAITHAFGITGNEQGNIMWFLICLVYFGIVHFILRVSLKVDRWVNK